MIKDYDKESYSTSKSNRPKLHNMIYKMATECAKNRRKMGQSMFETSVKYDTISPTAVLGKVIYMQGEKPVGWYDPATNGGYVSAEGLIQ